MIVDGRRADLGASRYLLSPGDLYALHHVPQIVDIGIAALKIEGRYKDADYVALVTRAYRQAVDEAYARKPLSITPKQELELEQVYSRGLGPFFVSGTNHQTVVSGRAPRHRGVLIGRVSRVQQDRVIIEPSDANDISPLKPGDGLVFDAADWRSPEEHEEGGRVFEIRNAARYVEVFFGRGVVDFSRIRAGDLVWRTSDPEIERIARPFVEATTPLRRQPVHLAVEAHEGKRLRTEWRVGSIQLVVESPSPLPAAQNRSLDQAFLKEQFGRLGGTAYELASITASISGRPFAPASLLNTLRREAVEKLAKLQRVRKPIAVHEPELQISRSGQTLAQSQLHLLVRTPQQLDAAIAARPASITLDYLDLYGLKPSVERVKEAGITVRVAGPRILKPGEERIVNFLINLGCTLLVRSSGLLETLHGTTGLIGDFSLNAANALTANLLLDRGLERITPSYDLNGAQVTTLANEIGGGVIEAIAYSHLPVFHTEHCVFCRFLSTGTSYKDCGRPCESHSVALRDAGGRQHPVVADVGCRNTVFGAEAQHASAHVDAWLRAGIRHFRLEFVHELPEEVTRVTAAFHEYLSGCITARQLGDALRRIAPQGTTEGSLFVPSNYQQLPVLQ
jgi:putative protease